MLDPFLHPEKTHPFVTLWREPLPVILNGKEQVTMVLGQMDLHAFRLRMPGNIVETFLDNPVSAGFVFIRNVFWYWISVDVHSKILCPRYLARLPLHGRYQAKIVEHGWAEKE
jgi:hypothetical protein